MNHAHLASEKNSQIETQETELSVSGFDPEIFLFQGELSLLKGDFLQGNELFETVSKLYPASASSFFRQGLALFEYGSEEGKEKALLLASKKLKTASLLNSESFETWHIWGNVLSLLAVRLKQSSYLLEAEEKYRKALSFSSLQPVDMQSDLFWDYAVIWHRIGEHSGEAADLQLAIDFFHKSSLLQDYLPSEFWQDFGHSCMSLAEKINDIRLFVKAIHCFKSAISQNSSSFEGWMALAKALQHLYAYTHDEDHFTQAGECFAAASLVRPNDLDVWLFWAKFLCQTGRRNQDSKRLRLCIEKCRKSYAATPDHPLIMAIWAEALALLGEMSDQLDLILEANNKISEALELQENDPEILYSYGMCLNSLGNYYQDIDYHYQAIESFQTGLSIDRTLHTHWHAIATTYMHLGALGSDAETLEKSFRFYLKALDLKPCSFYLFDYAFACLKLGETTRERRWLEEAIVKFEQVLNVQKNAVYLHPDWLYHYASALDMVGDFYEDSSYYEKAIEILSHVLTVDPDFPSIHHRLGLAFSHLGELVGEADYFYRAVHHYRLAVKRDEDSDSILLDWGVTLINIAEYTSDAAEKEQFHREAESKILQTAQLGNIQSYYHLGCLYTLLGQEEKALHFLSKAEAAESLPPLEEMMEDEWLDALQSNPDFQEFLTRLEKRSNLQG